MEKNCFSTPGWQRRPDGKVTEKPSVPAPQELYLKFVKEKKPVVFRQAVSEVPAMLVWQKDEYLKKK